MSIRRLLVVAGTSVVLLASLSACLLLPGLPTNGNGGQVDSELVDTTWSGVDSDGDEWAFDFQDDGTIGLTYNGSSYDDATDTWELEDGVLRVHAEFADGTADFEGDYDGLEAPVDLDGDYSGYSFTLTITRD